MIMRKFLLSLLVFSFAISIPAFSSADEDEKINDLVRRAMDETSFKVRLQAIFMLGRMGDKRAVDPLMRLTKDNDFSIRGASAIALGNIGDVAAIPGLFEMAKDKDKFVKRESLKALKKIVEKERAVTEVLAYVRKSDERVRAQAIELLGEIKNPAALKAVIHALADKDIEVASAAEEAIFKRDRREVLNILLQAMYDKTPGIRVRVIKMLEKINDPRAINVLSGVLATDIPGEEAEAAMRVLVSMSAKISLATTMSTLSNSPDKNTRNRMLYLLEAKASDKKDREAVITSLRSTLMNDPDHFIRGRAAQTIAKLGIVRLIPDIQKMMKKRDNKKIKKMLQKSIDILNIKKKGKGK